MLGDFLSWGEGWDNTNLSHSVDEEMEAGIFMKSRWLGLVMFVAPVSLALEFPEYEQGGVHLRALSPK